MSYLEEGLNGALEAIKKNKEIDDTSCFFFRIWEYLYLQGKKRTGIA